MKRWILSCLLAIACFGAKAQGEKSDSLWARKPSYVYMGIQTNLLIQQFIAFNSNTSINSNPYIFTYARNNAKSGGGFSFGTGFNVSQNNSNDGVSAIDVENVNVTIRLGYERKFLQQQKLIPFFGIDMAMGVVYGKTSSQLNQSFSSPATVTESEKFFFGPSFRAGLLYAFTRHIMLGTEFFFNFQISATSSSVNGTTQASSSTFVPLNIGFQPPTALFLVYRL